MNEENINLFLYLFFNQLELLLNKTDTLNEISNLPFHRDEANTDDKLKEYIKNFINNNLDQIIISLENNTINYNDVITKYSEISNLTIQKIYLPGELTDDIKSQIKQNERVYTDPDLLLKISDGNDCCFVPLELKSTKDNSIPGSSVQQLDGDEWVIFVQVKENSSTVIIGKYLWAINGKMQFPDRSPRPTVSFSTMNEWKKENKKFANENLTINLPVDEIEKRQNVINDWEQVLVERWLTEVQKEKISNGWFNRVLRNYTIQLLEIYKNIDDDKKEKFENTVMKKED